ncbi:hypothetical protein F4703DRAFT_1250662 [Phycomyces blakesleeanus]
MSPDQVEIYQHFNSIETLNGKRPLNKNITFMNHKLELMIRDYLDVGHYSAALDLVDTVLTSQRCPLPSILLAMVHCITRPVLQHDTDEFLLMSQRCYRLLKHVLSVYGSSVFEPIWNTFRSFHIVGGERYSLSTRSMVQKEPGYIRKGIGKEDGEEGEEGEEEKIDEILLGMHEYDDFWDLVSKCIKRKSDMPNTKRMSMRLILDILVALLEHDIYEKQDNNELGKCIFLMMLRRDGMGIRTQLDTYLDTLFSLFEDSEDGVDNNVDTYSLDIVSRIMNMLIYLAIVDKYVSFPNLSDQTYRHLRGLSTDQANAILVKIAYPIFALSISSIFLQDADTSLVLPEHQSYSKNVKPSDGVDKFFSFVLKTRPPEVNNIEDIYRHVSIVSWYWTSYMNSLSVCYENKPGHLDSLSGLSEDQTTVVFTSSEEAIKNWRKSIQKMIKGVGRSNAEMKKKVEQTMKLIELNLQII